MALRKVDILENGFNHDDLALIEMGMLALGVVWGISLSDQRYRSLKTLMATLTYLGCKRAITKRAKKRKNSAV